MRLEIEAGADLEIIERLRSNFALAAWQVFQVNGPINLVAPVQSLRPDAAAGSEISALCSRAGLRPDPASLFEPAAQRDHFAASSVRFVFDGGAVH